MQMSRESDPDCRSRRILPGIIVDIYLILIRRTHFFVGTYC